VRRPEPHSRSFEPTGRPKQTSTNRRRKQCSPLLDILPQEKRFGMYVVGLIKAASIYGWRPRGRPGLSVPASERLRRTLISWLRAARVLTSFTPPPLTALNRACFILRIASAVSTPASSGFLCGGVRVCVCVCVCGKSVCMGERERKDRRKWWTRDERETTIRTTEPTTKSTKER